MTARIQLIGPPAIAVDGMRRELAGRKPWALLAYLALGHRPTRRELAELLFAEAADPLAATRWALLQVRRALAGIGEITEPERRLVLTLAPETEIDAALIVAGAAGPAAFRWIATGELLDGHSFDDAPSFDQWLTLERQRISSATVDALRHAVLSLARSDPRSALTLADRAIAIEPFDDSLHELAVDLRVGSGDRAGAQTYVDALARRYRAELGIDVPDRIRRPLDRPVPGPLNPLVDLRRSAAALLELAHSRLQAGAYPDAIDAARRAAADGAASGDGTIERAALTALASVLIHSVRGRDDEATALLERALRLAQETGAAAATAEIERELGYVSFLAARYGAAEAALRRAFRAATDAGDPGEAGRALTLIGACESDRAEFAAARANIEQGLTLLGEAGDRRWTAFAGSFLARAQLRSGDPVAARATGAAAVRTARESGWSSLVPWCLAQEGDAALALGDVAGAAATFGHAFTLGCEIGDPCWEAVTLRGLARIEAGAGRITEALAALDEAYQRCTRVDDTYRWAEAVILTDMVLLEGGRDPGRVAAALALTRRGPMNDLYASLAPHAPQTELQTVPS